MRGSDSSKFRYLKPGMVIQMGFLKKNLKRILAVFGLRLYQQNTRLLLDDFLLYIRKLGLKPATVIDVGVAYGTFALYETFPDASHLLVEPLEEWREALETISHKYKAQYVIAAAGAKPGKITIHVHDDLISSSALHEVEGDYIDGTPREVPVVTLDQLCREKDLRGPFFIKVDVQGAELNVLDGATQLLEDTEVIVLEVSLFKTMSTNPELHDVVQYMKEHGFVTYDIFNFALRPLDGALGQVDMAFVKEKGQFRKSHAYATPEQRAQTTQMVKAHLSEVKKGLPK